VTLLELIDPTERCPHCFSFNDGLGHYPCLACRESPPLIDRAASAFDYAGPAATLVKYLKYRNQPFLAEGCAAYLAAQYFQLEWPLPDIIIPIPIPFIRRWHRGYNQSFLLSKHLGVLLERPVKEVLTRKSGDYSQAGLSYKQRLELSEETFQIKANQYLYNQSLLLVDDVMTTGTTSRRCAQLLREELPSEISFITLCRA
jgi:ComF family protein